MICTKELLQQLMQYSKEENRFLSYEDTTHSDFPALHLLRDLKLYAY